MGMESQCLNSLMQKELEYSYCLSIACLEVLSKGGKMEPYWVVGK